MKRVFDLIAIWRALATLKMAGVKTVWPWACFVLLAMSLRALTIRFIKFARGTTRFAKVTPAMTDAAKAAASACVLLSAAMSVLGFAPVDGKSSRQLFSRELDSRGPAMMRVNPRVLGPRVLGPNHLDDEFENGRRPKSILSNTFETPRGGDLSLGIDSSSKNFSRGVDVSKVDRVKERKLDLSLILPASLSPVSNADGVSAQIFDHSVSAFFKQGPIKNTFIGRTAETVEKKLKTEVELGGTEPDSIKHNLKFQVKASETKASMEYRGIMKADLSYSVSKQRTNLEIHEELASQTNLVYSHVNEPNDQRDTLSLRVNW